MYKLRSGKLVHLKTINHHRVNTRYQRFNKRVAIWITKNAGTMTFFWILEGACMMVVPSVLYAMNIIHWKIFLTTFGFELAMTWLISTNWQAIALPAIMVGQNLQNEAADIRAQKTFEDSESIAKDIQAIKKHLKIK